MEVQLIDYTGKGSPDPARYAAELLVFTKNTRLEMRPGLMDDIMDWSQQELETQLIYMANTIPSSWEFIHYTFLINDVTRAFTHQLVRTRQGSYAQQTMRILNVAGFGYSTGPSLKDRPQQRSKYIRTMDEINAKYRDLVAAGVKIEDARGILPTNIHTNIVAGFNMRTLTEMARKRASGRTQGEYRDVMDAMIDAVKTVHPWTDLFFSRTFDVAAMELETAIRGLPGIDDDQVTNLVKLVDQMRNS